MRAKTANIQSYALNGELDKVANEQFPILSFDQDLSSCLNITAVDAATMDSQLLFYDLTRAAASGKEAPGTEVDQVNTSLFTEDSLLAAQDLDPSFESNHNIQELINKEGVLFPDLLPSGTPIEGECGLANVTPVVESEVDHEVKPMPEVSNTDPTTQVTEGEESQQAELIYIQPAQLAALGLAELEPEVVVEGAATTLIPENGNNSGSEEPFHVTDHQQIQFCSVSTSHNKHPSNSRPSLKAESPFKVSTRSRNLDKNSDEYRMRRQRNNIAVRKSRDKAKIKQQETEIKVQQLNEENERLQKKVDLLMKELTVLKSLFTNVGVPVPSSLAAALK